MMAFLMVLSILFAMACSDSPVSPTHRTVSGTWQATLTADAFPGVRLTIFQEGQTLSGTWTATGIGTADPLVPLGGPMTGRVNRSQVTLVLLGNDGASTCRMDITALVEDSQMSGTYARFNCTGVAAGGSVAFTKAS